MPRVPLGASWSQVSQVETDNFRSPKHADGSATNRLGPIRPPFLSKCAHAALRYCGLGLQRGWPTEVRRPGDATSPNNMPNRSLAGIPTPHGGLVLTSSTHLLSHTLFIRRLFLPLAVQ